MRKNSIKNTRINGEVQRELSRIISREIKDPRIAPMTSVVDAVVTSDLKQCKAYISVLGNNEEKEETMKGLNSAVGYIRRELAHSINLRNTPEITFILDDSIEYGVNMSKKIDELKEKGEVMVLRPSRLIEVSRLEKDPEKLKALYQLGREDAMKNLDQIHAFLSK